MKNFSCKIKKGLALVLALAIWIAVPAFAEGSKAIIAQATLQLYSDAALTKPIGELDGYSIVDVSAVKNGVAKIQQGSSSGYVRSGALAKIQDVAVPAVVTEDTRVYESPDLSSRSAALAKDTQVNVLYIADDVALIEKNGKLGFTYVGHLTPAAESGVDDEADPFLPDAEATAAPSTSAVTVETLSATVTAASLPVYESARTSSKKLGALTKGQSVTVYAYNDAWAYIGLNGKYGFCSLKGLRKTTAAQEPSTDNELSGAIAAIVTAASVKVYQSASTASKSLGTLRKGAQVNVLQSADNWAYIELNGKYGYCALDALTRTSVLISEDQAQTSGPVINSKTPLGTATVILATAPLYDSMTAENPKATLKLGESVSYYGYDSKWVLIGKDGSFGFVPKKYLNADSYAELKADDGGVVVTDLENALLALGYFDGVPSATYTNLTTEAVTRFQSACGMTASGNADLSTLRVLYSGNAPVSPMLSLSLASGAKDDNVSRLQTRLHALGYLSRTSSIDGSYGAITAAAIRLFQSASGASATGTADNKTIRALYSAAAPSIASGTDAADAQQTTSTGSSAGNTTSIPGSLQSTTSQYVSSMSNAQKLEYVIYIAQQQLGKKYVFGSAGTATFDCSGLTMYCFKQVGVSLKHSAYSEGYNTNHQKISDKSSLRRGDLVFFNTVSDGDLCDHVGIYLGSYRFIHASSGAGKVVISELSSCYYSRVFSWGRRILST